MKHATKKTHDTPELDAPEIEAQPEEDLQVADSSPELPPAPIDIPQMSIAKPQLPATRAECETLMDTKHQHIAEAEARLLKAKAELDKLIGHHNNLPK